MIKNIVFDFGGVIVDIDRDKAVQAFIKLGFGGCRYSFGQIPSDRNLPRTGRRKVECR